MHRPLALAIVLAALALPTGCAGEMSQADGEGDPSEDPSESERPEPLPSALSIDRGATMPFVPLDTERWEVAGTVQAEAGLGTLSVASSPTSTESDGSFRAEVDVPVGLSHVEVVATDRAEPARERRVPISLLRARFLPAGALHPRAASLALDDPTVQALAGPHLEHFRELDVAAMILARETLTEDDCTTYPEAASHGPVEITVRPGADALDLEVRIPDLVIDFSGSCKAFIGRVGVEGRITTDAVVHSALRVPPQENCAVGATHDPPTVDVENFDLDVSGDGFFSSILVGLFGGDRTEETADTLVGELGVEADRLLSEELGGLVLFESSERSSVLGAEVALDLCLTGIAPAPDGGLAASIGAAASAVTPGTVPDAAGAPLVEGPDGHAGSRTLLLDAGLVAQLLFGAWQGGGLSQPDAAEVPLSAVTLLAPGLSEHVEGSPQVTVALDAFLPPLVRLPTEEEDGDLVLELGAIELALSADGQPLFELATDLTVVVELVPEGATLVPELVSVDGPIWVLEEPLVDVDDALLAEGVRLRLADTVAGLLEGAAVALPALGGALAPVDVLPAGDGRHVRILLP